MRESIIRRYSPHDRAPANLPSGSEQLRLNFIFARAGGSPDNGQFAAGTRRFVRAATPRCAVTAFAGCMGDAWGAIRSFSLLRRGGRSPNFLRSFLNHPCRTGLQAPSDGAPHNTRTLRLLISSGRVPRAQRSPASREPNRGMPPATPLHCRRRGVDIHLCGSCGARYWRWCSRCAWLNPRSRLAPARRPRPPRITSAPAARRSGPAIVVALKHNRPECPVRPLLTRCRARPQTPHAGAPAALSPPLHRARRPLRRRLRGHLPAPVSRWETPSAGGRSATPPQSSRRSCLSSNIPPASLPPGS